MDDTQSVRVVTTGHVLGGFDRAKCVSDLAKLTRQNVLAERLLDGAPHVVKRNIEAATAGAYVRRLRAIGVECGTEPEFLDLQSQPLPAAAMSGSPAAKKSTETIEKQVVTKNPSVSAACWIISLVGIIFLVIAFPIGITLLMVSGLMGWLWEKKKVIVLEGECPNCSSRITLVRDLQGAGCPICQKPFVSRNGKFQAV